MSGFVSRIAEKALQMAIEHEASGASPERIEVFLARAELAELRAQQALRDPHGKASAAVLAAKRRYERARWAWERTQ